MKNYDRVAEFLIELIEFGNEEDIKTLLSNCNESIEQETSSYKTLLLNYLFEYMYGFIEPKLPTLPPLVYENNKIVRGLPITKYANFKTDISHHTMLYLHLYALCECYYSYLTFSREEKKIMQIITEQYNKKFNQGNVIHTLTDKDRTKILSLLINSHTENRFYYYFYDDILTKIEIVAKRKEGRIENCYKLTKYKLQDKEDITYIINKSADINIPLKQKLVRSSNGSIDFGNENFEDNFSALLRSTRFQDIKSIHGQITAIIKNKKRIKYCKCCNPNLLNKNATALCDNCRKLLYKLSVFCKYIDENDVNEKIQQVKYYNFKDIIYNIKANKNSNIKNLRLKRKNKLNKIMQEIEKQIAIEINDKTDEEYYKQDIKSCIIKSFDKIN